VTKIYVILNPVAGSSQPDAFEEAVDRRFSGLEYEVYRTTGHERLAGVVRRALERGFQLVVAAGGDGTVSGVADGLAQAAVPLGIVPLGTGNVLARDLGIPIEPEEAIDLLLAEHAVRCIDALQAGGRFCVLNIGVGVSGQVMRQTGSDSKRRLGRLAYFWNIVRKLFGLERHRFRLTIDGREKRVRAAEILVLNSGALGSPYVRWGSDIQLDDGRVGVFALRPRSVADYARIAWNLVLRRQPDDPSVRFWQAHESLAIHASPRLVVQGDGDVIGQTPVEITVVPGVLQVIVPPRD
jgi:YegS/Rv2252/BmrU family lipid kinase